MRIFFNKVFQICDFDHFGDALRAGTSSCCPTLMPFSSRSLVFYSAADLSSSAVAENCFTNDAGRIAQGIGFRGTLGWEVARPVPWVREGAIGCRFRQAAST